MGLVNTTTPSFLSPGPHVKRIHRSVQNGCFGLVLFLLFLAVPLWAEWLNLKVAHGELAGMQLLMESVLLSNYPVITEGLPEQQATPDKNTQVFLVNSLHT